MDKLSPLKKIFCYYKSPLGKFTEWAIDLFIKPDVEVPVEEGQKTITVKCPCCVFWRGVAFGMLFGCVVGSVFW